MFPRLYIARRLFFFPRKKKTPERSPGFIEQNRLPLLPTSHLGFGFPLKVRLHIKLTFAGFEKDSALVDTPFETAHRIIEGFPLVEHGFNSHLNSPSSRFQRVYSIAMAEFCNDFRFLSRDGMILACKAPAFYRSSSPLTIPSVISNVASLR